MNIRISRILSFVLLPWSIAFSQTPTQDPMAIVAQAYQLQQNGDYPGAAAAYREFLKLRPNEVGAHSNLGVVLTQLGRYEEAISEYEAAQKLLPNDPRIALNLALAYEKSGKLPEATKRLQALHEATPQESQITLLLADAHLQAGQNSLVIDLLEPLEQQTPDNLALAYLLGTALIRQHRIREGQVLLDRIMKSGDSAEARFLLGMQMYESGDFPASIKQFAAASEVNPKLPDLQASYGQALLTTGDADGASAAFKRELNQNTYNYAANLGLGQILTVRKQYAEAEPLLTQALLMRPQSPEVQLALGQCYSGEGKLREARKQLQDAIKSWQSSAAAHRELASVDDRLHLTEEASRERTLTRAITKGSATPGPQTGELAPDFSLPNITTAKNQSLRNFRGKTPVVLVFGSYTCPNFRSAAESLKALQTKYGAKIPFLLIYIREAHGVGDWQSTRNLREGVDLPQATSLVQKHDDAMMCTRTLHLPFPALLDGLDNKVEALYAAWPSRAFLIGRDGRVQYSTRLTELDFSASDMEAALQSALAPANRTVGRSLIP